MEKETTAKKMKEQKRGKPREKKRIIKSIKELGFHPQKKPLTA